MLNDMLSNVVTILVSDKHRRTLVKLFENASLVMRFAVFQYSLNDSAAIWMGGQNMNLSSESFDDELNMLGWNSLNGLLHYVIAVLVLDTLENVGLKFLDEFCLLICKDMFQGLGDVSIR